MLVDFEQKLLVADLIFYPWLNELAKTTLFERIKIVHYFKAILLVFLDDLKLCKEAFLVGQSHQIERLDAFVECLNFDADF